MTLGQKIKEARRQAGLSQKQLAQKLIISRSAIARWETDLGMPDIDNLKALSRLLNISIDSLLEGTPGLQPPNPAEGGAPKPYCGKTCQGCTLRAALSCSGCKQFPHKEAGGCAIARCCQEQHMAACAECGYRETCSKLRQAADNPRQRLDTYRLHEQKKQHLADLTQAKRQWSQTHAPALARRLWALFGLSVLTDVLGIFTILCHALRSFSFLPAARLPLMILYAVCAALCAGCIAFLVPACSTYRPAVWFGFSAVPFSFWANILLFLMPARLWFVLPLLPACVSGLLSRYHLFRGHATVTEALDPLLSRRWQTVRKWQMGVQIACLCFPFCGLFLLPIPLVGYWIYGMVAPLLPCFALLTELSQLYHLFRTANLFSGQASAQPNTQSSAP